MAARRRTHGTKAYSYRATTFVRENKVARLHAFLLGVGKHSTFTIMKELHFTPSGTLVLSILLATHALRVSIDLTIRLWAIEAIVYKMLARGLTS